MHPPPEQPPDVPPKRRWLKRASALALALPLSAALAASAFFRIQLQGGLRLSPRFPVGPWLARLPEHLPWGLAFAACAVAILPLRALQWRFTLPRPVPRFAARYHSIAIGAFFHNAVPGKLGELFRALLLSRLTRLPFFQSLGSVLVCKLLELAALVAVVASALAGPGAPFASRLSLALAFAGGACALLLLLALGAARWALPLSLSLASRGRLPRLASALGHLGRGLAAVRSPRRMGQAFAASFGPVLASALGFGLALRALGVPHGLYAGGVVLGAVSLGQLVPGLPIGTGMYYLTSSWAARALGASAEQAAAFAALTHLASLAPNLLVGLASLALHRLRPADLMRERAPVEEAEVSAAPPPARTA